MNKIAKYNAQLQLVTDIFSEALRELTAADNKELTDEEKVEVNDLRRTIDTMARPDLKYYKNKKN